MASCKTVKLRGTCLDEWLSLPCIGQLVLSSCVVYNLFLSFFFFFWRGGGAQTHSFMLFFQTSLDEALTELTTPGA